VLELLFDHSLPPTVVMHEAHLVGVLGNRPSSLQMPPTRFSGSSPSVLDGPMPTSTDAAQQTEQAWNVLWHICGTRDEDDDEEERQGEHQRTGRQVCRGARIAREI
jgi:hypothetical protein